MMKKNSYGTEKISIIIPAFNEENFLPSLIASIKKQEIPCEIIIADSSLDNTKKIAEKLGCIVVEGGFPAKARNNGAREAKHDLLFLDADDILPDGFLKEFLSRIKKDKLGFATCRVNPISKNMNYHFCYMLKNYGNYFERHTKPHVSGQCLFVKKELFESVSGFDETLYLAEEHDLAQRLAKKAKWKFYMDIFVLNYPRRLEQDGCYKSLAKDIYSEVYRLFFKKIKHRIYERRYGHYRKPN